MKILKTTLSILFSFYLIFGYTQVDDNKEYEQKNSKNENLIYVLTLISDDIDSEKINQVNTEKYLPLPQTDSSFSLKVFSDVMDINALNPEKIESINIVKYEEEIRQRVGDFGDGLIELNFKNSDAFWDIVSIKTESQHIKTIKENLNDYFRLLKKGKFDKAI